MDRRLVDTVRRVRGCGVAESKKGRGMAKKLSAGLIPYRVKRGEIEVFLVHPGGPFWARKDEGAWSIAKGEFDPEEQPLEVAKREFYEETGFCATGNFVELGSVRQPSGKLIHAWAFEADYDESNLVDKI
jgi:predicted NUDIX family NTP pyrophosphohydrolase